jgi:hypothetical protein
MALSPTSPLHQVAAITPDLAPHADSGSAALRAWGQSRGLPRRMLGSETFG